MQCEPARGEVHEPDLRCGTFGTSGHVPTERSPPLGPASWPRYADLPLTYHPVPDIA